MTAADFDHHGSSPDTRVHGPVRSGMRSLMRVFEQAMPTGLFARSMLIAVVPLLILQGVVAYVFMERHWELVTRRLSAATARDIAAVVDLLERFPGRENEVIVQTVASQRMNLGVSFLDDTELPPPGVKPFFSILDQVLSREISQRIRVPFWIDTVGQSKLVEIRLKTGDRILRIFARRSLTYASNSHIFMVWMVSSAAFLIIVAILFLRNQIKPIERLAAAADAFGKGQSPGYFRPRGAREVRQASAAFLNMRDRIERQIEQRTIMLAGVSHDLRTVLTRFRLELALLPQNEDIESMRRDVDEMERMLKDYLAFAKGSAGEETVPADISGILEEVAHETGRPGTAISVAFEGDPSVEVRPLAFKRAVANLVGNAASFGTDVRISAQNEDGLLRVSVEDNGPGIPDEEKSNVLRPFYRLDGARTGGGGTGLGLAIALDIARVHGGALRLEDAEGGGLRAVLEIPS